MNIVTCMRVKTHILQKKGEKLGLFYRRYTAGRGDRSFLLALLACLQQQVGDLTCQNVLDKQCSPTTFTLLASSLLSH